MGLVTEAILARVVACYSPEEVVRGVIGLGRLADPKPTRSCTVSSNSGESAWLEFTALAAPHYEVARRVLGGVQYRVPYDAGPIEGDGATGLTPSLVRPLSKKGVFMVPGITWVTLIGHPSWRSSTRSDSRNPSMPCLEAP